MCLRGDGQQAQCVPSISHGQDRRLGFFRVPLQFYPPLRRQLLGWLGPADSIACGCNVFFASPLKEDSGTRNLGTKRSHPTQIREALFVCAP